MIMTGMKNSFLVDSNCFHIVAFDRVGKDMIIHYHHQASILYRYLDYTLSIHVTLMQVLLHLEYIYQRIYIIDCVHIVIVIHAIYIDPEPLQIQFVFITDFQTIQIDN